MLVIKDEVATVLVVAAVGALVVVLVAAAGALVETVTVAEASTAFVAAAVGA